VCLLQVVLLFLLCNTMALVINIVEAFFEPSLLLLNYLTDMSNFLVMLNGSVNVLIYLAYSPVYMHTLRCAHRSQMNSSQTSVRASQAVKRHLQVYGSDRQLRVAERGEEDLDRFTLT